MTSDQTYREAIGFRLLNGSRERAKAARTMFCTAAAIVMLAAIPSAYGQQKDLDIDAFEVDELLVVSCELPGRV